MQITCGEVKIFLHDFVDELLDDQTKKLVNNHIQKCESCGDMYLRLILFFDLLKEIPDKVEPPEEVIEMLSNELLNKSLREVQLTSEKSKLREQKLRREQLKQDRKLKTLRGPVRKSVITRSFSAAFDKSLLDKKYTKRLGLILLLLIILIAVISYFFK